MEFGVLIVWLLGVVGLSFLIIPVLPEKIKSFGALALSGIIAVLSSVIAVKALVNNSVELVFYGGLVFGDIPLRIDALSAWFILIINFTAFNGAWYGIGYTSHVSATAAQKSLHWVLYVVFHASMVGVCMVQNSFAFLIVWEIMSVSSLLLVLYDYSNPKTLHAGLNYLIQMHVGVGLITVGFIINYFSTGSFDFNTFITAFGNANGKWIFIVLFVGFGIKAGFFTLHTWLPHAHPAAPSHVSGVMSGVIVKLGIYGILRMITYLTNDLLILGEVILILSVITAFYGIFNAAIHRDFKKMLAYCTIENIGIIGMGMGMGLIGKGIGNSFIEFIGFAGALLHVLNHALYKSLLFFSAGNVYIQTHTRNMEQLGGVIKRMPVTAFFFLCGSLAICGLPPFNGFISEYLIYMGLIDGIKLDNTQFSSLMIICISLLALVGGLSLFTFTKSFGTIFLGTPRFQIAHQPREVSRLMLIPLGVILTLMIVIGVFPGVLIPYITKAVLVFSPLNTTGSEIGSILNILSNVGLASLGFVFIVIVIYFLKTRTESKRIVSVAPTWGCGYLAPTAKIQYTSKAYSRGLTKLFNFLTIEKKKYREIETKNIFPKSRSFQSYFLDIFEIKVIQRAIHILLRFTDYFTFIHNGKIQFYILYGVFFIISLIIITFFNIF